MKAVSDQLIFSRNLGFLRLCLCASREMAEHCYLADYLPLVGFTEFTGFTGIEPPESECRTTILIRLVPDWTSEASVASMNAMDRFPLDMGSQMVFSAQGPQNSHNQRIITEFRSIIGAADNKILLFHILLAVSLQNLGPEYLISRVIYPSLGRILPWMDYHLLHAAACRSETPCSNEQFHRGVLISGLSGHGKSTLTRRLEDMGAQVSSDDLAVVWITQNGIHAAGLPKPCGKLNYGPVPWGDGSSFIVTALLRPGPWNQKKIRFRNSNYCRNLIQMVLEDENPENHRGRTVVGAGTCCSQILREKRFHFAATLSDRLKEIKIPWDSVPESLSDLLQRGVIATRGAEAPDVAEIPPTVTD
jgi:hypothetical protein